ncbi:hypothetical protein M9194_04910 [Vibrio sp. S4M6]|uniref:hypothetical protein n=1 Tax=Vibrio sinus TaxID=2946865 RepID=UPI00202A03A7|nr:hypothetical protein [Vibrio sinus]MCL9780778.1 hypothetical protein [Vibrio sinus]
MSNEFKKIELIVDEVRSATQNASSSTASSACTAGCISTVSTQCMGEIEALSNNDNELAMAMATLHEVGVQQLGQKGMVDKIVEVKQSMVGITIPADQPMDSATQVK